jgi:predicted RecB family nuclease
VDLRDGELLLSASDLINFLECEHLTRLDLEAASGRPPAEPTRADTAELLARKGDEHEATLLEAMRAGGRAVLAIDTTLPVVESRAQTLSAMRDGAPLIHQAALGNGRWRGYADFLERVDGVQSKLGQFAYEPADAKLARQVKPRHVLQLCVYAELVELIQGAQPEHVHVLLGSGERVGLRLAEFSAYFRRIRDHFAERLDQGLADTYPLPVEHCGLCRWSDVCDRRWLDDDHLSLVANIRRDQLVRLEQRGITTVAGLAEAADDDRPARMGVGAFERLRQQARLQKLEERTHELRHELLPPEEGRGFALLPEPSEGDVFFDIEGDPFYEDGLEYLWGVAYREDGAERFRAFWGRDRPQEKGAFEEFIDFVRERRAHYPDMHVYHYAPYEPTALKRLMGLHATREEEVDQLLRGNVLVDLYRVVEQALRISRPSYSLKHVELFYMPEREASVTDGEDSILKFEEWLDTQEQALLDWIEHYNREDCISTLRLRDWLLDRRDEAIGKFAVDIPWRPVGGIALDEATREHDEKVAALEEALWRGLPEELDPAELSEAQRSFWLMGHLLSYHRREDKPVWWQLFARFDMSEEELTELDTEAIGSLVPQGGLSRLPPPSQSYAQRLSFPPQEQKLALGEFLDPFTVKRDPDTGSPNPRSPTAWEILELDEAHGELSIRVGPHSTDKPLPRALIPGTPYFTTDQRAALLELAGTVLDHGVPASGPYRAARHILARELPRSSAVPAGGPLQEGGHDLGRTLAVARGLEESYLFVQGPPGSGKTYTGAQLAIELLNQGKRVGVTAPSHKAICNLLAEIELHARADPPWRGLKKGAGDNEFVSEREQPVIGNSNSQADFLGDSAPELLAGTAWLWSREDMRQAVDYLVIDEAGQVSLADALAMATAADNVILLGDPLQLAQVSQAVHPKGTGVSVLEHLLGREATVPANRGVFLDRTRRMHPDITTFVSEAVYEGKLSSENFTATQRIEARGELTGTGVRALMVDHDGNTRSSPEEAKLVADHIAELVGANYTLADGSTRPLTAADVMVVAPYNAQVRCLREHLDRASLSDVAVGTVDKFQGQQAAVVFFSMATSSGEEIPRNVEFLYSRNRLNVAVSRAKCLAVLVCSPRLLSIRCRTVEQMRLVNALCLLVEMAEEQTAGRMVS